MTRSCIWTGGRMSAQTLRVGIPGDYCRRTDSRRRLARFRMRWPDIRFIVSGATFDNMLRDLKQGDLDVALAVTIAEPPFEAAPSVDAAGGLGAQRQRPKIDPDGPVPLVSLRRGLRLPARRRRRAPPGRARLRFRIHHPQPRQPCGRGRRRVRRHGDAARPRVAERALESGRTRRCRSCRSSTAASSCARAAIAPAARGARRRSRHGSAAAAQSTGFRRQAPRSRWCGAGAG